jgi:steroid 5-alpha reductase family enzyme
MIIKAQVDAVNPALWYLFNIVFIAAIQLGLLLLISTPVYIHLLVSNLQMEISWWDRVFSRALIGLVLIEALADQQQWG